MMLRLKVYDVMGREIERVVDKVYKRGTYTLEWEPKRLRSGVYFLSLNIDGKVHRKKIILNK